VGAPPRLRDRQIRRCGITVRKSIDRQRPAIDRTRCAKCSTTSSTARRGPTARRPTPKSHSFSTMPIDAVLPGCRAAHSITL
jgi:hypothetical protein